MNEDIKLQEDNGVEEHLLFNLSNIEKISNTLPGYIIKMMFLNKRFMSMTEILNETMNNLSNLRKADGSFYSGCIKKIILSTLNCTKLFISKSKNDLYINKKDTSQYIY